MWGKGMGLLSHMAFIAARFYGIGLVSKGETMREQLHTRLRRMYRQLAWLGTLASLSLLLVACPGKTGAPEDARERGAGVSEGEKALPVAERSEMGSEGDASFVEPGGSTHTPLPSLGNEEAGVIRHLETRYTKDIQGAGPLFVMIETTVGGLRCRLYEEKAPRTVDNFVGLARGLKAWREPGSGEIVRRPFYDGLVFHRVVQGLLVQSGDPTGTGTGDPGFTIQDEFGSGLSHSRAGVMSMAQSRPNGNGSQFFITDAAALHFDGRYPIFGVCDDTTVVHVIAGGEVGDSSVHRPTDPVRINKMIFTRASP